jgi:hypothetical protein
MTWTKTGEPNPHTVAFAADTAYTATVALAPNPGDEIAPAISFTHSGGTVGSKSVADGAVTVPIAFAAMSLARVTGGEALRRDRV